MEHDPLFKALLKAFFREFLELFYHEKAEKLDFATVSFLDKGGSRISRRGRSGDWTSSRRCARATANAS